MVYNELKYQYTDDVIFKLSKIMKIFQVMTIMYSWKYENVNGFSEYIIYENINIL